MTRRLAACLAAALAVACAHGGGPSSPASPETPPDVAEAGPDAAGARPATAGAPLLALLPAGAAIVVELDLARLRANPTAGPVVEALGRRAGWGEGAGAGLGRDVDVAVLATYRLGRPDAATVTVARGAALDARAAARRVPGVSAIGPRTVVLGPEADRAAVVRPGAARRLSADALFLRLRDAAMPAGAPGAAVRATARLTSDERITIAGRLGVDEVPATVSLWLDVADDAAMVALLGADDEAQAARAERAIRDAAPRAARLVPRWLEPWRLARAVRAEHRGAATRIVWHLPPREFAGWSARVSARLAPAPDEEDERD